MWFVEGTGSHGGTKHKCLVPSDDWSEEIPSNDGGDFGDADDDKDTNFSFSPELSNKLGFCNNQWSGEENDGYCCDGPMGKTQNCDTHSDEAKGTEGETHDPDKAKVDLDLSRAETDNEKAFSKTATCDAAQTAARKDNSQQQGNILNEGDKVYSGIYYKGEAEEEIRCCQPHSDLYPKQPSGFGNIL